MSQPGYYRFDLNLTLEAPFLIAGTRAPGFGIDVGQMRDRGGNAIIPATHIRGVLRHACGYLEENGPPLAMTCDVLFGKGHSDPTKPYVHAARLWFRDLVSENQPTHGRLTRVSIDDDTGAARRGHLLVIEEVAPVGATVPFKGKCCGLFASQGEADTIAELLTRALRCIVAMGRFKTAGYGRVADFDAVTAVFETDVLAPALTGPEREIEVSFTIDSPLLVGTTKPDANTVLGAVTIPGAALKGALARKFDMAREIAPSVPQPAELDAALSRMRVSHAFLGKPDPDLLNKVQVRGKNDLQEWHLISADAAVAFRPDIKLELDKQPGSVVIDERAHVAIGAGGVASEGALFTEASVSPFARDGNRMTDNRQEWTCRMFWPGDASGAEFDAFRHICGQMAKEHGVFTLGKNATRTLATGIPTPPVVPKVAQGTMYEVVLTTPCLMMRQSDLADQDRFIKAIDTYWDQVSGGALRLARENEDRKPEPYTTSEADEDAAIFTLLDYRGGQLALRYPHFGPDVLEPFVLCRPGSVFHLAATGQGNADKELTNLHRTGLPAAEWGVPATYQTCPFCPENGFGAFDVQRWEDRS